MVLLTRPPSYAVQTYRPARTVHFITISRSGSYTTMLGGSEVNSKPIVCSLTVESEYFLSDDSEGVKPPVT